MESTTMAIVFIIGKAAIWLVIPLLFGIYEVVKHRKDMAREARGEAPASTIPGWLQAKPRQDVRPAPAGPGPEADPEPLPVAAGAARRQDREAA